MNIIQRKSVPRVLDEPTSAINVNLKLMGSHCNMRCSYCYEHDTPLWSKKPLHINEVSDFLQKLPPNAYLRILLHGGEPLLYPKSNMIALLREIQRVAGGRSHIRIQTNGTLIDDEWINIFKEHCKDFVFSISIDTLKDDENRILPKKVFSRVIREKLELLRRRVVTVGVVSVVSRTNVDGYEEFVNELVEHGVKYLTINKLRLNTDKLVASNYIVLKEIEFVALLERLFFHWITTALYNRIEIQPFISLTSSFGNQLCTFSSNSNKCDSFISLYPGGVVTGCDHRGVDEPKRFPACSTCPIFEWCGSGCIGEDKDETFCEARFRLHALVSQVI